MFGLTSSLLLLALAPPAAGKPAPKPNQADRVLVVINSKSPTSVEIGNHYVSLRKTKHKVLVQCQDSALSSANETLPYSDYAEQVEKPIQAYLKKNPGIDFIVLTKGMPIRLAGAKMGLNNDRPSLDSTLASLGYDALPNTHIVDFNDSGFKGKCWFNRFWNSTERFSHAKFGGYLVCRLDAYTLEEAKLLTLNAIQSQKSKPSGTILIDVAAGHGLGDKTLVPLSPLTKPQFDPGPVANMRYNDWDADLMVAAELLKKRSLPVLLENTPEFIGKKGDLMGYASWGSNDPQFNAENYKSIRFAAGGIAETAVSTSGRTFLPTQGGQSLIADLIHARVSGAKGYCDEPLLPAIASPTVLFDRYTKGWTLAESYYAASRFVGWEDIVIGDPLCAPYATP